MIAPVAKKIATQILLSEAKKAAKPAFSTTKALLGILAKYTVLAGAFSLLWVVDAMKSPGGLPFAAIELFFNAADRDSARELLCKLAPANLSCAVTASPQGGWNLATLDIGDLVGGHRVTSDFGPRSAPCSGCSSYHRGVDVATPEGTPLFTPLDAQVECKFEPAGGHYARITSTQTTEVFQALHLKAGSCKAGQYTAGSQFAETGNTGRNTTGEHLDWQQLRDGQHINPEKGYIEAALTGVIPQKTARAAVMPSKDLLWKAIGHAEGTVDINGNPTAAYGGHSDFGNGAHNMGAFSYQHGAATPEEADAAWLEKLEGAAKLIDQQAIDKFGVGLSEAAMVVALDAYTQSPDAGQKRFVKHLAAADPTPEQLSTARIAALNESRSQPGIGGPSNFNVPKDQERRVSAILEVLEKY